MSPQQEADEQALFLLLDLPPGSCGKGRLFLILPQPELAQLTWETPRSLSFETTD